MVAKRLRESKAKFAVCSLSGATNRIFRIVAFDKVIEVFESRSEAIEAIKKMGGGRNTFQSAFIQDADLFFSPPPKRIAAHRSPCGLLGFG